MATITFTVEGLGEFTAHNTLNATREFAAETVFLEMIGAERGIQAEQLALQKEQDAREQILTELLREQYQAQPFDQLSEEDQQAVQEELDRRYYLSSHPNAIVAKSILYRLNALRRLAELQQTLITCPEAFDPHQVESIESYESIFQVYEGWSAAASLPDKKKGNSY